MAQTMINLQEIVEIANSNGILFVKNNQPGIVVFYDDESKQTLELAANGDPEGGDLKQVSTKILLNPEFRNNLFRGIFSIVQSTDPRVGEAIGLQVEQWNARQHGANLEGVSMVSQAKQRVASGAPCIAPDPKSASGECGTPALDDGEHAPLCTEHKGQSNLFQKVETGRIVNGAPELAWQRAGVQRSTKPAI